MLTKPRMCAPLLGLALLAAVAASRPNPGARASTADAAAERHFQKQVQPLLVKYCYDCHGNGKSKGDLALDAFQSVAAIRRERQVWELVMGYVRSGEMPPKSKPSPTQAERERIAVWVETTLFPVDCDNPDPGRVTIRRLNRVEYSNTIRDLVGVKFEAAEDFPADDTGYGFDTIGDVLSMPPLLFEKYLAAAGKILDQALAGAETRQRLVGQAPASGDEQAAAREIVTRFATRAWRRPVTGAEVERLMKLVDGARGRGDAFEASVKLALQAILVSPHFLFRGELQPSPDDPRSVHLIDEYALASRLSYFLWSSMPDDELAGLAAKQALRKNLEPQVRRMLKDRKARALVDNFAGQWLQLRKLHEVAPDKGEFAEFDEDLRAAMLAETAHCFEAVMRENRSVLEFLDADYTYLNERLARHYGVNGVQGADFRKVSVKGTARGGLLTQASILTLTSNPTRTSPVKRGKWVLDNILGTPPPPPPPSVPELSEQREIVMSASLRQRLEQHRADPNCATCHERMDPIGFGLENFNGVGAWRDMDGNFPVDPAGVLVSGESFEGPAELKAVLLKKKKEEFVHCLAEKMLIYALGRGTEYYDRCALEAITQGMARRGYRFSSLVIEIARSVPFQMRRGEGDRLAETSR